MVVARDYGVMLWVILGMSPKVHVFPRASYNRIPCSCVEQCDNVKMKILGSVSI
jgi:hypothetical protein